ncbi:Lipoprotein LppH (modular protein) [uncultured Mycobacterium sp.]|uniref:Lipoprotein LppH (Modular protein) n=1 Tax=uncultured Mycobacterium sp. TaxID=171292 RepID=A0A1Y5PKC7_9MYCO|nr:Lipoprotein LppH (modular protein) [uncultured Mycobacterium sp.]
MTRYLDIRRRAGWHKARPLSWTIVTIGVVAATSGCTTTVAGQQEPGAAARAAVDLEGVLLTGAEVDAAMGASGMAADTTKSTLVDDSAYTTPIDCLAVSSMGQEQVYAGTNWTSARMQSVHEPGEDYAHLAHQAVIEFPDAPAAAAFLSMSTRKWPSCAPGRYTYSPGGGQAATVWDVGPAVQKNNILSVTVTEHDSDSWACQRALTAALNIVVDVLTCSAAPGDSAAAVAGRIADKVTGQ